MVYVIYILYIRRYQHTIQQSLNEKWKNTRRPARRHKHALLSAVLKKDAMANGAPPHHYQCRYALIASLFFYSVIFHLVFYHADSAFKTTRFYFFLYMFSLTFRYSSPTTLFSSSYFCFRLCLFFFVSSANTCPLFHLHLMLPRLVFLFYYHHF